MGKFPDYLETFIEADDLVDDSVASGIVQCECGHSFFEVLHPGRTVNLEGKTYACGIDTDEGSFFLIEAKCTHCGRAYRLFDQDFHGWDGFQCHDHEQAALPRPPLVPWLCLSCAQLPHKISIRIDHTDLPQYRKWLDKAEKPFDENEWLLSFEWIWMTIECGNCGLATKDWVDYETT